MEEELQIPTWALIPMLMLITGFFWLLPHMNYSATEWLRANGLVSLGVAIYYGGSWILKK